MSITKKLRFEVFKRDGFQCAYCGKSPPAVVLEIDHIKPKSRKGKDDLNNLLTACFDCNRGKTNIPLDKAPQQLTDNLEVLKQKEAQLVEYQKYVRRIERRINRDIVKIDEAYSENFPKYCLSDQFKRATVKRFVQKLPLPEIISAMHMACSRFSGEDERAIRYFCGICWNKIKGVKYEP